MRELLMNAWNGWLSYLEAGKGMTLFLLVLLLMWLLELGRGKQKFAWWYCLVMGALCICPVTAAILMKYQTRFYDYQWIWSVVPITAMAALGGILVTEKIFAADRKPEGTSREGEKETAGNAGKGFWSFQNQTLRRMVFTAAGILALVLLCGRVGNNAWKVSDISQDRKVTAALIRHFRMEEGKEYCLLAPEHIMAQARSVDPRIRLAYGRNMWTEHLNAFSYDTYTKEQRELYVWMVMIERNAMLDIPIGDDLKVVGEISPEGTPLVGREQLEYAKSLGVNRILFPGYMPEAALTQLEEILGTAPELVEGYYLFCLP